MSVHLHLGDARAVLASLEPCSVHAIACDPPYFLNFMGRAWDAPKAAVALDPEFWALCLRVLKPGGFLSAFGAPRAHHRVWCAVEDGGFEIRDTLPWLRGKGYPKNKSSLKPLNEPILIARKPLEGLLDDNIAAHQTGGLNIDACRVGTSKRVPASVSTTPNARAFGDGIGGPAAAEGSGYDPTVGRWPPNVLLSHLPECEIVGTREVATGTAVRRNIGKSSKVRTDFGANGARDGELRDDVGFGESGTEIVEAWSCAPGCIVAEIDAQSGPSGQKAPVRGDEPSSNGFGDRVYDSAKRRAPATPRDCLGGASRFFPTFHYSGPAATQERDLGCDGFYWQKGPSNTWERVPRSVWEALPDKKRARGNIHNTVKPISVMRWLVRLLCPPGGIVLDPFLGSGTTALACVPEGLSCVGIEQHPDHYAIARARIQWATTDAVVEHGHDLPAPPEPDQPGLF